jgi:hypothetical protein
MSDNKKKEDDAAKALLNMGANNYTGAPSESDLEFNYDPPGPQTEVSSIYNRRESGTTNPKKLQYDENDTYATMAEKDAARNAGMLTPEEMENLFNEAQERQYQQQRKGGKSRRRKSRKSRKNRRKTYRRKN